MTASRASGGIRLCYRSPSLIAEFHFGEVVTPLIPLNYSTDRLGGTPGNVIIKDEGRLPTGSFKARGLALAVSMAHEFGLDHLAIPTNGNAGAAMAAYARKAGMKATVLCPLTHLISISAKSSCRVQIPGW